MKTYKSEASRQLMSTATPHRPLSVESDVIVPLLQALVSGLVLTVISTGVLWGFIGLDFAMVFWVSLICGVAVAWLWRLGVADEALWVIEEFLDVDINQDSIKGKPSVVRLEQVTPTGLKVYELAGIPSESLQDFAVVALTGRLNERLVEHKFGLKQAGWNELRDNLIGRGVLRWKGAPNSTGGVMLTDDGVALMSNVVNHSPTQ